MSNRSVSETWVVLTLFGPSVAGAGLAHYVCRYGPDYTRILSLFLGPAIWTATFLAARKYAQDRRSLLWLFVISGAHSFEPLLTMLIIYFLCWTNHGL